MTPHTKASDGGELVLELPMPPSVNSLFRNVPGHGRAKTKLYKDWIKEAHWMLIAQRNQSKKRHKRIDGNVSVEVKAYRAGSKRRDLDNILKALLDLLTNTQTIADDSQVVEINARWVDAGVPCTVILRAA